MVSHPYAELHAHSYFTFLEGADAPEDYILCAQKLGLDGLALLERDGMYSLIRSLQAARESSFPLIIGTELTLSATHFSRYDGNASIGSPGWGLPCGWEDTGIRLPILTTSHDGYRDLCSLMSERTLEDVEGENPSHGLENIAENAQDIRILTGGVRGPLRRILHAQGRNQADRFLNDLISLFGRERIIVESVLRPGEDDMGAELADLAHKHRLPLAAAGGVTMASPGSKYRADLLCALRQGKSLDEIRYLLPAQHSFLKSAEEMLALHRMAPQAVSNAAGIARECYYPMSFDTWDLPEMEVPQGHTTISWLTALSYAKAQELYGPRSANPHAWEVIDHELSIIGQLDFAGYFLIVYDIVDFCRRRGIMCQGRGSAANSAVCYCLGITAVDAIRHRMLFERFLSPGRSGAPDIDIDIDSARREEVIQYVYQRYGRRRAAQVATVITYRSQLAYKDAARALGIDATHVPSRAQRREESHKTDKAPSQLMLATCAQLLSGLPRHMGIHSGGMILSKHPVSQICPIRWAKTRGRSVIQWDKEDCADAGLVKFDLLGLGMLGALGAIFDSLEKEGIRNSQGKVLSLYELEDEDPRVYDLLCAADTMGVFQVESRAQMNTLPRLQPRCFYDIVIEVALIRPGPIQGESVHPYLRRRRGEEKVSYLHPLLRPALEKTLGVPLFQEQMMHIAMDVAGFSAAQADELRRAMGSSRSAEKMKKLRGPFIEGMKDRGIPMEICEEVFRQVHGFADFGFPESHSFSFAYIVYASAWLKVHYPEHFYAGILSHQPMGFYSPSSLVHDARGHGLRVCAPDVNLSLESTQVLPLSMIVQVIGAERAQEACGIGTEGKERLVDVHPEWGIVLGLDMIRGLDKGSIKRILRGRHEGPYQDLEDLASRARLRSADLERLSQAGAVDSMGYQRREGIWASGVLGQDGGEDREYQPMLEGLGMEYHLPSLPPLDSVSQMNLDYEVMGLSVTTHPFALIRKQMNAQGVIPACEILRQENQSRIRVAGIITHRQRPCSGGGVLFLSLEDESGSVNVTVTEATWKQHRREVMASAVVVDGYCENAYGTRSIRAFRIYPFSTQLRLNSRDFR